MFVIEVIPLVRGIQIESLSYFSGTNYPVGSIIAIPVRGKTIRGIVVEGKAVSSTKTALKAATFSLRKLPEQKDVQNTLFLVLADHTDTNSQGFAIFADFVEVEMSAFLFGA